MRVPRAVVAAGRLAQVCALVLLVPGEAARIASDLDARPRG